MSIVSESSFSKANVEEFLREVKESLVKTLRIEAALSQRPANEVILDDVDLQNTLKVSKRHTAFLRESGLISFLQPIPNGKIYYTYQAVIDYLMSGWKPSENKKRKF